MFCCDNRNYRKISKFENKLVHLFFNLGQNTDPEESFTADQVVESELTSIEVSDVHSADVDAVSPSSFQSSPDLMNPPASPSYLPESPKVGLRIQCFICLFC